MKLTIAIPFYRQPLMLRKQLETFESYDDDYLHQLDIIVVDDGSPEPAIDVIEKHASQRVLDALSLYRVTEDIPWNRGGARNLATTECVTSFIIHVDIDHVLIAECFEKLCELADDLNPRAWYRFPRWRVGKADETRRKDAIPDSVEHGKIKPHIDSYICTPELYWKAGGYQESFSGCLGGGSPFLAELTKVGGEPGILPDDIYLQVHTRHSVPDASVFTLDRDTTEYTRRKKTLLNVGKLKGHDPLRFQWERVL